MPVNGRPVNVLIIEDSEDDALLIIEELREAGYNPTFKRVETSEDMSARLRDCVWDIIIADHSMPHFSAAAALETLQATCLDVPFILVSGTVSTKVAVDLMRRGATDFVLKDDLARLVPAITRELREAEVRRLQRQAEENLLRSEARLAEAQRLAHLGNYEFTLPDGRAIWSEETYRIFGMEPAEPGPTVDEYMSLVHPDDRQAVLDVLEKSIHGRGMFDLEYRAFARDGSLRWVHSVGQSVTTDTGGAVRFFGTIMDVTERKMAEDRRIEMEQRQIDFYRRTILAATEGKLVVSEPKDIDEVAGSLLAEWNIESTRDVGEIRRHICQIAGSLGMDEEILEDFVHCSGEAITNAVKHATGGKATLHTTNESLLMVVSDRGKGIEALALPELALVRGYTTGVSLGMGYKIMISLADKVYLSTGPEGTTVALKKGLHPVEESADMATLPETWTV